MSTRAIYICNFCGLTDNDVTVTEIPIIEDFHVCEKCENVVGLLLSRASKISIRNPTETTHGEIKGLQLLTKELYNEVRN